MINFIQKCKNNKNKYIKIYNINLIIKFLHSHYYLLSSSSIDLILAKCSLSSLDSSYKSTNYYNYYYFFNSASYKLFSINFCYLSYSLLSWYSHKHIVVSVIIIKLNANIINTVLYSLCFSYYILGYTTGLYGFSYYSKLLMNLSYYS